MVTARGRAPTKEICLSKLRIAILGISYESLRRSPVPTTRMNIHRGQAMLGERLWLIRGAEKRLKEEADVEIVPIQWANTTPGGGLELDLYESIRDETMRQLGESGPYDGILVINHGAMEVIGLEAHPDTDYLRHVRAVVGEAVPVVIALDLHGHLPKEMLGQVDGVSVLRTAPHRDDRETGYRAADQLMAILRTGVRQKIAAMRVPILVPGELSVTTQSPARELYADLPQLDGIPGMIEANIMVGFAWNDLPWMGMTIIAASAESFDQAGGVAMKLAERVWSERRDFILREPHAALDEALDIAAAESSRPIHLTDSGDNTTAGAPGDLTTVLQLILDRPDLEDVVVTGITAPGIVDQCKHAGVGTTVTLHLGAEHLSAPKTDRVVPAVVEAVADELPPHPDQIDGRTGAAWARVRIGHVLATFHASSIGVTTPNHLRQMGIDPLGHRVYVLKLGYNHPELSAICARHIILLTDGSTNLDVTRLTYDHVPRPAFPIDPAAEWSARDKIYFGRGAPKTSSVASFAD